ncbi:MAG TPA: TadE family protein [Pyrinomonadaceae bacterium]|nr:TadE family protein [Pyrinomonadaceae bacterium]
MHARIRRIRNRRRYQRFLQLHRFTRDESGLQLVEAAIVIPIFLVMFAATAEFGRFFYEYTTLAKAARNGSRYIAMNVLTTEEKNKAKNMVVYGSTTATDTPVLPGLEPSHVVITQAGGSGVVPATVTIQIVGYQYEPIFDLGSLTGSEGLSLNIDVSPSVTMRYLLDQPPPI